MPFMWRKRLFLLLLPVFLGLAGWQIQVNSDLNAFFTAVDSEDSALLAGMLQSGELSKRYLLWVQAPASTPSPDFSARFIPQLESLAGVDRIWPAHAPPREWLDAMQGYARHHGRIYSLNPEMEAAKLFDPQSLGQRALGLQSALLAPQGGFVKAIAKQDPLLLSLNGFKSLQNRFQAKSGMESGDSAWVLQSQAAALDVQAQAQLQALIHARFSALNAALGGGYRLRMTGMPIFTVAAHAEISRDVGLVSIVSSVGVALVFLLLFRSFSALHWMLLIQAASFAAGAWACQLAFATVYSLTLALGATLIGICADYPMHVLAHCAKHRNTPDAAARLLWPSLLMGGLTTVIGYAAMGMTGFPGLQQIAVFAAASIAASLGLTRWVLPALLGKANLHPAQLLGLNAWIGLCERRRTVLLGLLAVAAIAAGLALPGIRWMDDLQKLAMDMGELRREDEAVRAHFSNVEPGRFVLVQAADLETALQRSEKAERRLQTLQASGVLTEYYGLFPWLVSAQLQAQNASVYAESLTPAFREAWRAALAQANLAVDKLGGLALAEAQSLSPEAVLATPVRHILAGQIIQQKNGVALSLWLGQHDPGKLAEGLAGLEGTRYFSQREQLNRMAQQHRDRSLDMLAIGIALMAVLIWLQQRSLAKTALTLLPALASVLFIFAAWAVLGEEVSFLHVIGLLLSISLCVDYGIFFMDNRGQDASITYHAIASSTLTTLASFGALGLAKTPTLPVLAVSVSLGVSLGFLLCPLLIRPGRQLALENKPAKPRHEAASP
jgi:predicted exporter